MTTTPPAPRSSKQRVGRHRGGTANQPRHGHRGLTPDPARRPPSWRPGTAQNDGGGRAQPLDPTPPPWAGSSIGTTSPGGAQSRRSSRVEPPNPRPRAPGAVYPSSNSPKRKPSKKTAPVPALKRGPGAEVEVQPAALPLDPLPQPLMPAGGPGRSDPQAGGAGRPQGPGRAHQGGVHRPEGGHPRAMTPEASRATHRSSTGHRLAHSAVAMP